MSSFIMVRFTQLAYSRTELDVNSKDIKFVRKDIGKVS